MDSPRPGGGGEGAAEAGSPITALKVFASVGPWVLDSAVLLLSTG